jgi:dTDP-4-dehydrorhamnose reductase
VHAAAWTDVDGCEKDPERALSVNAGGSANVAAAATEKDTPVIAISTDFVFNGEKRAPYTPEDIPDPLSVYGRSKLEGEKAIMDRLSRYAVVRTSWLYGRNGKNFVDTIVNKARSGEKLKVVDDQVGSPTYTVDLSAAILKLIERGTAGKGGYLFQVSNSGVCSWYEFALAILDYSGSKDADIKPIPSSELLRPARRPLFSAMDNGSFEKETGYRSRHWREALKEYIGK